MCGRFVQIIDIELFVKRFGVKHPQGLILDSNYNVAPGDFAYVISNDKSTEIQAFQFGFTPSWEKEKKYVFNARAEGDLNKANDVNYSGEMGIVNKPYFRTSIKSKRCLVIANGYIEGPEKEKLDKPFHIHKKNGEVFCFAGIWDTWADNTTGVITNTFSIITTVANPITQEIEHHRSPVILDKKDEKKWLDDKLPIEEVLKLLKPHSVEDYEFEPISIRIKTKTNKGPDVIIPIDPNSTTEYDISVKKDLKLQGMGQNKRKNNPPPAQGSLF
ncbi:MAG: SOS response-associated peptidase [Prolixibacteraceae bacterium]|nr:SOS response-associated peptidase [Prolixibacteraceae bacterium]